VGGDIQALELAVELGVAGRAALFLTAGWDLWPRVEMTKDPAGFPHALGVALDGALLASTHPGEPTTETVNCQVRVTKPSTKSYREVVVLLAGGNSGLATAYREVCSFGLRWGHRTSELRDTGALLSCCL